MSEIIKQKKHSISLFVTNRPGVLIRVSLVFARRGCNLESVVVSPANDPKFARMNLTAIGEAEVMRRIIQQLNKLVDVIHAKPHDSDNSVNREIALIKIKCSSTERTEILQIAKHFKSITVDITHTSLILQAVGDSEKLDALHTVLGKYNILEYIRSGKLIMTRGEQET